MHTLWATYLISLSIAIGIASAQQNRVAVAHLSSDDGNINGSVYFNETPDGVWVLGTILGKEPGLYGFHVHELGDTLNCLNTGAHFNPDGTNHGGRNHTERHVGDLGNVHVEIDGNGIGFINFTDSMIALRGRNNILGRGLVLHEQEDDLGLGGHADSLTTGNAGARVACAVIGMHTPLEAWDYDSENGENSSSNISPTIGLLIIVSLLFTDIFEF